MQNTYSTVIGSNKTQFEVFFEKYIERRKTSGLADTTLYNERLKSNNYILSQFKDMNIGDISNYDIETYRNYLNNQEQLNAESKNEVISIFLRFCDYLVLFNHLKAERYNDFKRILETFSTKGLIKSGCKGIYDINDFNTLISTFTDSEMKYKLLIEFIFQTGARGGEARSVWVEDFDFVNKTVRLHTHVSNKTGSGKLERIESLKTDDERIPELPTQLCKDLLNWVLDNNLKSTDYIFYGVKGPSSAISENALRECLKKHFKLADLNPIRVHDFRHSHICVLFDENIDDKVVSDRVGHKDISTTRNIYDHVTKERKNKLTSTLDKMFS